MIVDHPVSNRWQESQKSGAGQVTKACNQVVIAQTIAAVGEAFVLATLAFMVLLLGVWPAPLIDVMEVTVTNLVEQITVSKL